MTISVIQNDIRCAYSYKRIRRICINIHTKTFCNKIISIAEKGVKQNVLCASLNKTIISNILNKFDNEH